MEAPQDDAGESQTASTPPRSPSSDCDPRGLSPPPSPPPQSLILRPPLLPVPPRPAPGDRGGKGPPTQKLWRVACTAPSGPSTSTLACLPTGRTRSARGGATTLRLPRPSNRPCRPDAPARRTTEPTMTVDARGVGRGYGRRGCRGALTLRGPYPGTYRRWWTGRVSWTDSTLTGRPPPPRAPVRP